MPTSGVRERLLCFLAGSVLGASVLCASGLAQDLHSTDPPDAVSLGLLSYDHGGVTFWGTKHFMKFLRDGVSWLEHYPHFKLGLDNDAYTYDYLADHDPEALEELKGYLARFPGRFGVGSCTYGQPLMQFQNDESNIRQIAYAMEADQTRLGVRPTVYLMSEHAMHAQIPQILNGLGFTGAIMRTHFMMYGYNPTVDAPTVWWAGLDGSRIPAVPTYGGEGAAFFSTTDDDWILTRCPGPECSNRNKGPKTLEAFREKFAHIGPLLATRADDSSLRSEGLVRDVEGDPRYRWMLLEEVFPSLPVPVLDLKALPNDFHVRMPWGFAGNEIWNRSRQAEVAVLTAERLAALALLVGGADHETDLHGAWKDLLIGQHHDIQIVGLLPEARRFLPASVATSERVRDESLRYVAAQMKGGSLTQLTVFNPVSWPRREWVDVQVTLPAGRARSLGASHRGKPVPSAVLCSKRHPDGSLADARIAVLASLPPLGTASYSLNATPSAAPPTALKVDEKALRISTRDIEIRLDPSGGISSLRDKRSGADLLTPGKRGGFFAGRIDGKDAESKGEWTIERGPGGAPWAVAREKGTIADIPYTLEITVRADSPRLDCRMTFEFRDQKIGRLSDDKRDRVSAFVHEEKLRFKLFPSFAQGSLGVRDLPFAIATTSDSYLEGNYWTALTDGRLGLAIFNRGTMGSVREADGGVSVPLAFSMYYIWKTLILNGEFTYEFALLPFSGDWRAADLHRQALAYNFPVVAIETDPGNGRLGDEVRPFGDLPSDVLVSAFYTQGRQTYLRLFEHAGIPSRTYLRFLLRRARWSATDLLGQAEHAAPSPLTLRPWQIQTLRLEPLP